MSLKVNLVFGSLFAAAIAMMQGTSLSTALVQDNEERLLVPPMHVGISSCASIEIRIDLNRQDGSGAMKAIVPARAGMADRLAKEVEICGETCVARISTEGHAEFTMLLEHQKRYLILSRNGRWELASSDVPWAICER